MSAITGKIAGIIIAGLIILLYTCGVSPGQQTSFSGPVVGAFEAATASGIGLVGTIEGRWEVAIGQNAISAGASGVFGGTGQVEGRSAGASGTWTARLNPDGRTVAVEWVGPGGQSGGAGGTINLTLDTASGTASGEMSGIVPTENGFEEISGVWNISFPVVLNLSSPRGAIEGAWSGLVTGNVSGEVQAPGLGSVPVNIPFSTDASGAISGDWSAAFSGDLLTGSAGGDFQGSSRVVIDTPTGPLTVEVPITGTYLGSLNGDLISGVRYDGSWTAVSTPGSGIAPGFGGPFSFTVDVAGGAPFAASGTLSGGGSYLYSESLTVSYTVVGDWTAQMGLD